MVIIGQIPWMPDHPLRLGWPGYVEQKREQAVQFTMLTIGSTISQLFITGFKNHILHYPSRWRSMTLLNIIRYIKYRFIDSVNKFKSSCFKGKVHDQTIKYTIQI